jgi:hypothetical protein
MRNAHFGSYRHPLEASAYLLKTSAGNTLDRYLFHIFSLG